jgi:hypothetical protein
MSEASQAEPSVAALVEAKREAILMEEQERQQELERQRLADIRQQRAEVRLTSLLARYLSVALTTVYRNDKQPSKSEHVAQKKYNGSASKTLPIDAKPARTSLKRTSDKGR